jgi:hypothetical protein
MAQVHEITLGDGTRVNTAISPERFAELGIPFPKPALIGPESGALAFNVQPTTGGQASDAIPGLSAALGGSAPGRVQLDPLQSPGGLPTESAESVAASDKAAAQAIDKAREGRDRQPASGVARFGATTADIPTEGDAPGAPQYEPPRPRFVTIRAKDQKGADIRTGYQTQKSGASDLLPEYDEQAADARINTKLAAQELSDVKQDQLERERGMASEEVIRREEFAARQAEQQRRLEAAAAKIAEDQTALDAEHDAITKLKVNPNEYVDNLGTGGKILAAIAMIAGGINAGMRGGPNQAAEFIYRAIRDNIADQREKIAARRQGYNVKQTQLEKKSARLGGDIELAAKESEANQLALAAAMGRKHMADAGIASANPELMMLFAKMDQDAADMRMQNAAQYGQKVSENWAFRPDQTVQVGGAAEKPEQRERKVRLPGGGYGFVRAANDRAPVQEKLTANGDVIDLVKQMRSIAEDPGLPLTEKRAQWEALRAQAEPIISVANKQGAMSDGERDGMNRILGNPSAILSGNDPTRLKVFEQGLTNRLRSTVRDWVHADPEATIPLVGGQSQGRRYE